MTMWSLIVLLFLGSAYSRRLPKLDVQCDKNECVVVGDLMELPDEMIREGDIIADLDLELSRNAFIDKKRRWPQGIVPYVFHNKYSLAERNRIEEAMKGIEAKTCVKFEPMAKVQGAEQTGYVMILPNEGCKSNLGYWATRGQSILSLNPLACLPKLGVIQHELLHVLGLKHEHARPDRDLYVDIVKENIQQSHMQNFWKADEVEFTTYDIPYNYESVMHYKSDAFSKNGKPTIVAKNGEGTAKMGQRKRAHDLDLQKINKMYCS
uniref:Metalloendopeptidase n=1 Tax=Oncocephalus sp. TaxID=2944721 RepID=A0AB38ZEH5_9HEMI